MKRQGGMSLNGTNSYEIAVEGKEPPQIYGWKISINPLRTL